MLYPPTLASTQPVFTITDGLKIKYSLNLTAVGEIGHYQLRIINQETNKNVYTENDGVYYQTVDADHPIFTQGEIESPYKEWKSGTKYKIQMRFGSAEAKWKTDPRDTTTTLPTFADWKIEQINNNNFSEWSTVMVVKAISGGTLAISGDRVQKRLTPIFQGSYSDNNEPKTQYRFALYEGTIESPVFLDYYTPLEEMKSYEISATGDSDTHKFNTVLSNHTKYTVAYWIKTLNGYEPAPALYSFETNQSFLNRLEIEFYTKDSDLATCRDNGCIKLYGDSGDTILNGTYVISRASEKSDYKYFDDIKFITYFNTKLKDDLIFADYAIESGVKYLYAISRINSKRTIRTDPLYIKNPISIDFEYSYLYRDDVQLRLMFNQKMSSFKHTTLRTKQDTIGDKYPHLVQNGQAYYAEFPITGLISLHMDEDQTFFTIRTNGLYYKDELVVPADKIADRSGKRGSESEPREKSNESWEHKTGYEYQSDIYPYSDDIISSNGNKYQELKKQLEITEDPIERAAIEAEMQTMEDEGLVHTRPIPAAASSDTTEISSALDWYSPFDLAYNNIFIERKFREKVEEFLNDFNYKLYKSPTEGDIIVSLLNVSLTPKEELGRMIYEFSANAYEVLDNTIENLDESGIINIGEALEESSLPVTATSFGQFIALPGDDIQDLIAKQEYVQLDEEKALSLATNIAAFTNVKFNLFPTIDLTNISNTDDAVSALNEIIGILETEGEEIGDPPYTSNELMKDLTYSALYHKASTLRKELIESYSDTKKNEYLRVIKLMWTLLSQPESMVAIEITPFGSGNSQSIYISPMRPYQVETPLKSIALKGGSNTWPVIIEYVCNLEQSTSTQPVETDSDSINVWGQISGVYSANTDLFNVIKQKTIAEIKNENTSGTWTELSDGRSQYKDGEKIYTYEFTSLKFFEIEADDGTLLAIQHDGSSEEQVEVGITPVFKDGLTIGKFDFTKTSTIFVDNRYQKTPAEYYRTSGTITGITLNTAQYIIVNYRCSVLETISKPPEDTEE